MTSRSLCALLALASFACAAPVLAAKPAPQPKLPLDGALALVTAGGTYATVERLAAPEYGGRLCGTPGYDAAARWAAGEFKAAGLQPPAGAPDYLQRFPVVVPVLESAEMDVLPADGKGEPRRMVQLREYLPILFSGTNDVTAEVVFVGFGITAPEYGRDDYAGLDVAGKIVMTVRGAPKDGRDWSKHNSHRARSANAKAHGAAGFLFAELAGANPNGEPVPGLAMATVADEIANGLLEGSKLKLDELRRVLGAGGVASFPTGRRVRLAVKAGEAIRAAGSNVIGILPGSDPALAGEYVVVGGHLDHVGAWPRLLPGADDNASGSATVLAMARAAAALGERPRRTLVFVLFGGEEMGLLGSKAFVAAPPAGLGRCVGVYNLDMVGVGTGAYVSGGENFPALFTALGGARDRQKVSFELRGGKSEGEPRADHGPFQAAGIPAVSLFGMGAKHQGYHTDEDTLAWITPRTMELAGRIVMEAAVRLADE